MSEPVPRSVFIWPKEAARLLRLAKDRCWVWPPNPASIFGQTQGGDRFLWRNSSACLRRAGAGAAGSALPAREGGLGEQAAQLVPLGGESEPSAASSARCVASRAWRYTAAPSSVARMILERRSCGSGARSTSPRFSSWSTRATIWLGSRLRNPASSRCVGGVGPQARDRTEYERTFRSRGASSRFARREPSERVRAVRNSISPARSLARSRSLSSSTAVFFSSGAMPPPSTYVDVELNH